jgi:hypothetical protein
MELDSIRPGIGKYVKYGEIFKISIEGEKLKLRSVFTPGI